VDHKISTIRPDDPELSRQVLRDILNPKQTMSATRQGIIIGLGAGTMAALIFGPEIVDYIITATGVDALNGSVNDFNLRIKELTENPDFNSFVISRMPSLATLVPASAVCGGIIGRISQSIKNITNSRKLKKGLRLVK
jgi:hypothetical protein